MNWYRVQWTKSSTKVLKIIMVDLTALFLWWWFEFSIRSSFFTSNCFFFSSAVVVSQSIDAYNNGSLVGVNACYKLIYFHFDRFGCCCMDFLFVSCTMASMYCSTEICSKKIRRKERKIGFSKWNRPWINSVIVKYKLNMCNSYLLRNALFKQELLGYQHALDK